MDKPPGSSMPKELSCPSEHTPSSTSGNNPKDQNDATIPGASHDTRDTGNTSGGVSLCSSEKDSGYSESSDWQQTDAEDQQHKKTPSKTSECMVTMQSSKSQEHGQGNAGISSIVPGQPILPTVYILKNMLKQPDTTQRTGRLLWKDGNTSGASHMILCQQPVLLPATLQPHKSLSRKVNVAGRKTNGGYVPILNSYPRIAPHPSQKPPGKSSANNESQNMNKRVFSEHRTDGKRSLAEQHFLKQPKLSVATTALSSGQPYSSTTTGAVSSTSSHASLMQSSLSAAAISNSSFVLATRCLNRNSTNVTRHRRFVNTLEILQQSGLLDLTLRTKELLRQSNAMDQDIAQLRQHTQILCQVANNHNCNKDNIVSWESLHRTMAESSNYPNLQDLREFQSSLESNSTGHLENRSLSNENPNPPPSPLNTLDSNHDPAETVRKSCLGSDC